MFERASNFTIHGGSFTSVNEQTGMTGLQILSRAAVHDAAYDSAGHAPKCHPETRKTIVGEIMSWIEDASRTSGILWFNGPAGAGKTAIASTLSELCAEKQWLAGSYFFLRLAGRSDAAPMFATIAYQLSVAIPAVGKIIEEVVVSDPAIVKKELEIQLQKLIVEPLRQILDLPKRPIVILIDGLDECQGDRMQLSILRLLGSVFRPPSIGGLAHICFIVTSRPEPWIHNEFTIEPLPRITRQMFLGQTAEANDDIRTFFRIGFTEIHDSPELRLTMSNVPKPWPSYHVLDGLVERASGQFIYPATVLKFVGDPNYRPTDRLEIISSMRVITKSASNPKPLAALDQLYTQIISTSTERKRTLEILSALIAMQAAPTEALDLEWSPHVELLRVAEKLLGLRPGDGPLALRMVHSLVHITEQVLISDIPDDNLNIPIHFREEDEIRFHHKSFVDYLVDPLCSLEYYVDEKQVNTQLALACMVTMQKFSLQSVSRIACITWGYAIVNWTYHIFRSGIHQRTLLQALACFDMRACYLDTLGMEEECLNIIKRVAFPTKPTTLLARIAEKLGSKKGIIDETCPKPADVALAREFLFSSGARGEFTELCYSWRLRKVMSWMKECPDSPPKLLEQYQVVSDILDQYSLYPTDRFAQSDNDFIRNARRATGSSTFSDEIIEMLLKWKKWRRYSGGDDFSD